MRKKTIDYNEYLQIKKNIQDYENKNMGLVLCSRRSKLLLGSGLVFVGIITLPFPTGSLIVIPFGIGLILGSISVYHIREGLRRKLIRVVRWLLQ